MPPAPALLSPVDTYTACAGSALTFTWDEVLTATAGYELEWTDAVSGTVTFVSAVPSLALPGGLTGGSHTWRVRSVNDCGAGLWSGARGVYGIAAPLSASLRRPADRAQSTQTLPAFTWNALTDATSYTLQVSTEPGFDPLTLDVDTTALSYTASGTPWTLDTYYWRVRGANVCATGPWSEARSFELVDELAAFLPVILKFPEPPCTNLIANGGFESDSGWTLSGLKRPVYTTDQFVEGTRSLLLGVVPPNGDGNAYSSAYQAISLSAGMSSATLGFWMQRDTEDTYGDAQQVVILDDALRVERVLANVLNDSGVWSYTSFDLTDYIGRTIFVYFNVVNDGDGSRTWMYLDEVVLDVCS